jgi:hypothetical protein
MYTLVESHSMIWDCSCSALFCEFRYQGDGVIDLEHVKCSDHFQVQ